MSEFREALQRANAELTKVEGQRDRFRGLLRSAMLRNERCPWCDGAIGLHGDNDVGHLDWCDAHNALRAEEEEAQAPTSPEAMVWDTTEDTTEWHVIVIVRLVEQEEASE